MRFGADILLNQAIKEEGSSQMNEMRAQMKKKKWG